MFNKFPLNPSFSKGEIAPKSLPVLNNQLTAFIQKLRKGKNMNGRREEQFINLQKGENEKENAIEVSKAKEEKESKLSYKSLEKEANDLKKEGEETFAIFNLTMEGGEELIDKFSVDKFTDAIEKTKQSGNPQSMYEVIKILEPDKQKRQKLYEEMVDYDNKAAKKFEERANEQKPEICELMLGHSQNNINIRLNNIKVYKHLDNLSSLPEKTFSKIKELVGKGISVSKDTRMALFEDFDTTNLKEQLKKYEDNIVSLVIDRNKKYHEDGEKLIAKQMKLIRDLEKEIEQITTEVENKYLNKENVLLNDLEGVIGSKPEIEVGKKIIDSAISSFEGTIKEYYQDMQREIKEKTHEQQTIIQAIVSLHP